jgi:hypothetical protein
MTDEESPTESHPTESQNVEQTNEGADEAQPTEAQASQSEGNEPTQAVEQRNTSGHGDEAPLTESLPTQSQSNEVIAYSDESAETPTIRSAKPVPDARERMMKRAAIVAGAIVLVAALAFGLTQFFRSKNPPAVEQAAAEVFLEPANSAGDSPFAPSSFATPQPDPTNPGSDPLGPPPAQPAPAPDGAAPMAMRTANGDLPGLYGGTLDTTTCDAQLMIDYLNQNPDKATAWASVHRIAPNQIAAYVGELTPVLLRTDTRVTDHGYMDRGQAVPRQAVLQAGTAVMIDKYGAPRVKCYSGNPLLDPVAVTAARPAAPGGNVVVQQAANAPAPRVIYVGPRWPRFDPLTIVIIRRVLRIIDIFVLWDFRRGVLFGRQIGILIRDIANLLDPRLARLIPPNLLPARRAAPPPLPLQPPRPLPAQLPVQPAPQRPPVQPAPQAPVRPAPQAPPGAPPPIVEPNPDPPPIVWPEPDPDPPVRLAPSNPGMPAHPQPASPGLAPAQPPMGGGHTPAITGGTPSGPSPWVVDQLQPANPGLAPAERPGVVVPKIDGSNTNPLYPQLPNPNTGGGHVNAPGIQDTPDSGSSTCDPEYQMC